MERRIGHPPETILSSLFDSSAGENTNAHIHMEIMSAKATPRPQLNSWNGHPARGNDQQPNEALGEMRSGPIEVRVFSVSKGTRRFWKMVQGRA